MESYKTKNDAAPVSRKPRVWGIVLLGILRGVLGVFIGLATINDLNTFDIGGFILIAMYLAVGLAVFAFISAILLATYSRWGLYTGLIAFGGDIALGALIFLTYGIFGGALGFLIDGIIVYYLLKWMREDPATSHFK